MASNDGRAAAGEDRPAASSDMHTPVAQLQWAVTGYSLVGAAVIVTSGALGDVFGRRRIFLAGLVPGS